MLFIAAIVSRIHIFCLGFAVSGACMLLGGLLAAYPHTIDTAGSFVLDELAAKGD